MDRSAKLGSVEGSAGLQDEGEDVGVKGHGKRGLHVVENSKGLVMASVVDVGGYELGKRKQA